MGAARPAATAPADPGRREAPAPAREPDPAASLVVFEDLHWIDAETQALVDALVESLPAARLLMLVNYRPEYQHAWGSRPTIGSCVSTRCPWPARTNCSIPCSATIRRSDR